MQVLLIRHAIAQDRATFKKKHQPDANRPLSKKGITRMVKSAQGLTFSVAHVDRIFSSPYTRARQTAEIVHRFYPKVKFVIRKELIPSASPKKVVGWLQTVKAKCVVLVGHEPQLSCVLGYFLTGQTRSFVDFKKGGACLVGFSGKPEAGNGLLIWFQSPAQLRGLS